MYSLMRLTGGGLLLLSGSGGGFGSPIVAWGIGSSKGAWWRSNVGGALSQTIGIRLTIGLRLTLGLPLVFSLKIFPLLSCMRV